MRLAALKGVPPAVLPARTQPWSRLPRSQATRTEKQYGKRPAWQWTPICILAAIVLYGLAYLIFFRRTGTGSY